MSVKMGLSRQEVNLRRLLAKCELLCRNKKDDERFPKYIETLDDMLQEVRNMSSTNENITDYQRRIIELKLQLGLLTEREVNAQNQLTARDELLGIRQRNTQSAKTSDLDELINFHQDMQNKVAEDILTLTQSLKEQSQLANKIIKQDTEVVGRSSELTEKNFNKLKVESDKLSEHSKRAWKCWMWIMLLIVLVAFINMVLFMKVVKKKY